MTLHDFPPRPSVAARLDDPAMDVTLVKDDRLRRYQIRPAQVSPAVWSCQVWFSDRLQHRGQLVDGLDETFRFVGQYHREIVELRKDGWTVREGTYRRDLVAAWS